MKNLDLETIATLLGTALAGVFIGYKVFKQKIEAFLKNWSGSVSSKVPKQSQIDIKILNRMEEVKEILDADRVQVYEFHNGEHYANGRSALKVSCTYEVCRIGVKSIQRECMSLPISCIPRYIAKILDNIVSGVADIEEVKDVMPATYNLKVAQGINAYINIIIRNRKKEPVGFIEIQWFDKSKFVKDDYELMRMATFVEENILNNLEV